jgi:hypothetical protein
VIGALVRPFLSVMRRAIDIPHAIHDLRNAVATGTAAATAAVGLRGPEIPASVKQGEKANQTSGAISMPMTLPSAVVQRDILSFCGQFAPYDVEGFKKIRLGNKNDGGYIFIDDFADVSMVISCGISNDVTCDLAFAERDIPVLQFDHTVDGPPISNPKFTFHKQAIDAFGAVPGSVRLWDIVDQEGNREKVDLLLKIDIDGDEWATFANFPIGELKRFRQISCEFHWSSRLKDPDYFSRCLLAITNIRKAFFPAHLHANNFRPFINLMGVPIPEVYEVTFVNSEIYRPGGRQRRAPTEIDNPNDPDAPDLFLGSPFGIG